MIKLTINIDDKVNPIKIDTYLEFFENSHVVEKLIGQTLFEKVQDIIDSAKTIDLEKIL